MAFGRTDYLPDRDAAALTVSHAAAGSGCGPPSLTQLSISRT
jgi:hypothetical protein